jgi:hypothetical protein
MRLPSSGRASFIVGIAFLMAILSGFGCYESPRPFQPVAYGAQPWQPPPGWDPEPPCATGYFVAINSCTGCTGISYALCTGISFTQCVCGGPFWPGAMCPQTFVCTSDDFPPFNWLEFTAYAGPGWAGLQSNADAGPGASP